MLNLVAIDHVVLRTTRLDEMLHFYCEVLGARLERTLPGAVGLVQLRAGSGLIDLVPVDSELGRLGGKPPDKNAKNMDHFCMTIAPVDVSELRSYLADKGVIVGETAVRYGAIGNTMSVYIQDPEANIVELKLPAAAP